MCWWAREGFGWEELVGWKTVWVTLDRMPNNWNAMMPNISV